MSEDIDKGIPQCSFMAKSTGKSYANLQNVDKSCLYHFPKSMVRIEYPGLVNNIDEAVDTLGGMSGIEMALSNSKNKLDLHLNLSNRFMNPCSADKDNSGGILIHVEETGENTIDYDVVGVVTTHFKFNRLYDFIYLPVMSKTGCESDAEYVHDQVFPKNLPDLSWFISKETAEQPPLIFSQCYGRSDYPQNKMYNPRGDTADVNYVSSKKKPEKSYTKVVNFNTLHNDVPDQPPSKLMEVIERKGFINRYVALKKLFDERPVWQRVAIMSRTGLTNDQLKLLLPSVAYYSTIGPWRTTWIRYGYNPIKDFNSRKYQTLDYRVKNSGADLAAFSSRRLLPQNLVPKPMASDASSESANESHFVLRPGVIPPSKQKIYQYCDILYPEIQDMLQRLPKLPAYTKYDPKNGWLPFSFTEQCREIVTKNVLESIQKEFTKRLSEQQQKQSQEQSSVTESDDEQSVAYCSQMLSNMQKGIFRTSDKVSEIGESQPVDIVNLIDDADDEEDIGRPMNETLPGNSDSDSVESSEYEIDPEALEEINEIVSAAGDVFK